MSPPTMRERAESRAALDAPPGADLTSAALFARDVLKLLAVVEALPKCDVWDDCGVLATKRGALAHACDKHAAELGESALFRDMCDLPYAAALRALLEAA